MQVVSICSIFENEADFHKWVRTKDLNPDQGLGINGVQDPLDGVVANVLDGDLEEGVAILIQATDITWGLTLLMDKYGENPNSIKVGSIGSGEPRRCQ